MSKIILCLAVIISGVWAQLPKLPADLSAMPGMPEMEKLLKEVGGDIQKCMDQAGASMPDLSKGFPGLENMSPDNLCLMKCVAKTKGLISENGDIIIDQLKQFAPPNKDAAALKEVEECLKTIGKVTKCEDMVKVLGCALH